AQNNQSIKTRIETKRSRIVSICPNVLRTTNPSKQGLKLLMRGAKGKNGARLRTTNPSKQGLKRRREHGVW
ncbi:MAG: hypothetical protein ACOCSQ_05505, partial [Planctomycetota bacterium]